MQQVTEKTAAGAAFAVRNPRTGEVLYTVREPDDESIGAVYAVARAAFPRVRELPVRDRLAELAKLQHYILRHREAIIDRIVQETGKARTDALVSEIFVILDAIAYYRKRAAKFLGEQRVPTPFVLFGKRSKVRYEPLGAVLVISPWNYPFHLGLLPCISAFLAGCSVVYKPSEWTPLQGLFEEMFRESGFMHDAIQVVYGGKETGQRLIDAQPAKVFFTGSTRAGRAVMAQAAPYLIPVELELGGKDPMIVFDDVDLERTVQGALWGGATNSGQTCTSVERLYVQEGIYPEFVARLSAAFQTLRSAAGEPGAIDAGDLDVGGMTTPFQLDIIESHLADAVRKGAKVLVGGKRGTQGLSFEPTLVVDVDASMTVASEETFGPVLPVMKFKDEDEAVRLANASPYGLSSSVWSGDIARAERVARRLEAGNVCVNNVMSTQGNAGLPFGGVKASGFGRYHGAYGLHSFCNVKAIMIDPKQNRREANWYPYTAEKYGLFSRLMDALYSGRPFGLLKAALIGLKLNKASSKRR